jgi:ABC-type bacteriocin/lantibiotic exporter with double-glycine peptidase domain
VFSAVFSFIGILVLAIISNNLVLLIYWLAIPFIFLPYALVFGHADEINKRNRKSSK